MATINDIAKMAGVSAATVSHVVNKTRYVSPELVKRVEDAIESLEYPPNFVVKKNKSSAISNDIKYIACLCSDLSQPFQIQVCRQLKKAVEAAGYIFLATGYSESELGSILQIFTAPENAKGLFLFSSSGGDSLLEELSPLKIPVVLIGSEVNGLNADCVCSENFNGAYKATNHLIKSGHRNIALVYPDGSSKSVEEIIAGYKSALAKNEVELSPQYLVRCPQKKEQIFSTLQNLMTSKSTPTAILCTNYKLLICLFDFLQSNNIECPKDVSVIGFEDFAWMQLFTPAVTTVSQDSKQTASAAAAALLARVKAVGDGDEAAPPRRIDVPVSFNVRASTHGIGRGPFGEIAVSPDVLKLSGADIKMIQAGHYTAAISFHYMDKAWSQLHQQGIQDVFNSLKISLLAITDAHFDPVMQSKQLESILTLEPDIIISIPTDNVKTASVFKKVARSKAKLVLITNVPNGLSNDDYVTCVSVNERSNGRFAGRGLGDYMVKHNKTNIGLIRYKASFYATNQRDNAAEQILREEYPELKLVGSSEFETEDAAYEKTRELMTAHPEIEGLYVSWEGPAAKVISALNDINRTDVAIATTDLEYSMALNMAKGGMVKAMSAQCPYEQGQAMALAAANALIGKRVPPFIGIEPIYVTPDNLLRSWQTIFKEKPSVKLVEALKENPNYIPEDYPSEEV